MTETIKNAESIIALMQSFQDEKQRQVLLRFFKTGIGEYGYGDDFLGIKVPKIREVVKKVSATLSLQEVPVLLTCHWHEVRLCGFLILVAKFEHLATKRMEDNEEALKERDAILQLYVRYADYANNWDLVDLSAPKILGHWLLLPTELGDRNYKQTILNELANSTCLWKQRISMVCTLKTLQEGDPSWCLRYAEKHLHHSHDLMHKAVGWMLRELGKRVSMDLLRDFLQKNAHDMPRTTLRYAIEKMADEERRYWMSF